MLRYGFRHDLRAATTAVLSLSILLAACTPAAPSAATAAPQAGTGSAAAKPGERIIVGLAMKTQVQPRWQFEVNIMQEKAKDMGVDLLVQWANDDISKQASQVENLLSQGAKVLIIVPVDDKTAGSFVEKAHAAKVPVISYDIGIQNADVDYFTTRDNHKVGKLQAEGALQAAPTGNYVLVKGDQANNVARELVESWDVVLKPQIDSGKIKVVSDQWNKDWLPDGALKQAENALTANNNDVKAFVTANDGMASGVAQAIRAQNLAGKTYLSGLDVDKANAQLIVEGTQTLSVWTKIDEMAVAALQAAVALAKGEKPQADTTTNNGKANVPTKLIDVVAVNKENMCEFITKISPKGWVSADEVYKNTAAPANCK